MLHPIYEQMVREWEDNLEVLERAIFTALKDAMPGGRTRRELVADVFGVTIAEGEDINNNKYDRLIRKTIEHMRDNLIPIFSASSEPGYRLEISETSISIMVAEWQRRRDTYDDKIRRGNQMILRIREADEQRALAGISRAPAQHRLI